MMDLIEELIEHKTVDNEPIVEELIECIKAENVTRIEELEDLEDKMFAFDGKVLNIKQRISYCYIEVVNAYYDYDGLSLEEIKTLKGLKDSVNNDKSDEENILNLIKIYSMTNRELMFLTEAYEFILKGIL